MMSHSESESPVYLNVVNGVTVRNLKSEMNFVTRSQYLLAASLSDRKESSEYLLTFAGNLRMLTIRSRLPF